MNRPKPASRDHQIRQGEQAEQLRGVLEQPLVAHLAMTEQILDDMKRMLVDDRRFHPWASVVLEPKVNSSPRK